MHLNIPILHININSGLSHHSLSNKSSNKMRYNLINTLFEWHSSVLYSPLIYYRIWCNVMVSKSDCFTSKKSSKKTVKKA